MITQHIAYNRISLEDLITLADQTLSALNRNHPEDRFLAKSKTLLEESRDQAKKVAENVDKKEPSKRIAEADYERDNSYDSLRNHIKAGLIRHNLTYRNACARLYAILIRHNTGLASLPHDEETAALKRLFTALATEAAISDLETVNATEWLEELKADQRAFEAVDAEREREPTSGKLTETDAIKMLVSALQGVFKVVNVAAENSFVDNIQTTIDLINSSIDEIVAS